MKQILLVLNSQLLNFIYQFVEANVKFNDCEKP